METLRTEHKQTNKQTNNAVYSTTTVCVNNFPIREITNKKHALLCFDILAQRYGVGWFTGREARMRGFFLFDDVVFWSLIQ